MIGYLLSVWSDFAESWSLLSHGWLVGWLVAATLAWPGILVVAREQIFIGAAVSQASACGVAIGFWLVGFVAAPAVIDAADAAHSHAGLAKVLPPIAAVVAAVIAALATAGGLGARRGSAESRTGWVFLAASAFGVLLLTRSPHGAHEVERLIASSLLGAEASDVGLFAVLATATGLFALVLRRRLTLLAIDPAAAQVQGLRRKWWDVAIALWLGLSIGLAIRVCGLLFAFGCLVLPALAARGLCREVRSQFLVAPALAVAACVIGFALANHHDLPPAQVAVALLCAIPLATGTLAWLRGLRPRAQP